MRGTLQVKKIAINMHNSVCDTIRFGAKWHIIYNDLFYIPSSRPTMYRYGAPAPPTSLSRKTFGNHISWVHSNASVYVAGLSDGDADANPIEFSHKSCCSPFPQISRTVQIRYVYSRTPDERPPSPTTIPLIRPHFV